MECTEATEVQTAPGAAAVRQPTSVLVRTGVGAGLVCVVAALVALDSLWPEGFLYAVVAAIVAGMAMSELAGIAQKLGAAVGALHFAVGGMAVFVLHWAGSAFPGVFPDPWVSVALGVGLLTMGALAGRVVREDIPGAMAATAALALGLIYVPLLLAFLTAIRTGHWGSPGLVTVLAVCKGSSTGAYFTGKALGRHKMSPKVSPNKTVEGLIGSFAFAVAISVGLALSPWALMGPALAVVFGLVICAAGALGDLAASLLKREAGIKDSGSILPGLGGFLDMADDLLFAAPVAYLFLACCGTPG